MARYQKGQSGNPAGRKPGSKNKFTKLKSREVWQLLNERDCNPFEILADLAMDETVADRTRMEACGILCEYCEPKLKSVEMKTGDSGIQLFINTQPMSKPNEEKSND